MGKYSNKMKFQISLQVHLGDKKINFRQGHKKRPIYHRNNEEIC